MRQRKGQQQQQQEPLVSRSEQPMGEGTATSKTKMALDFLPFSPMTQADVTESLDWIKTLSWTGLSLLFYAILQSSVGLFLSHDASAREDLLSNLPISIYQHSAAAFFTAMSLNLISFVFEETADKRQLALLSALIKGLAWHCDRLLLTGQSVIMYDTFGVIFQPNRYIQWIFTTPTILFVLSKISNLTALQVASAIVADVVMIITGLLASLLPSPFNWLAWVTSMVTFCYVMWMLKMMIDGAIKESSDKRAKNGLLFTFYTSLCIWSMFPLAWLLPHVSLRWVYVAELMTVFSNFAAKVVFSSCIMYNNFLSIAQRHLLAQLDKEQTERIQMMADLRESISRKDNFLSIISHELRTPLNAIIQLSNALTRGSGGTLTERGMGWVQTISDSGLHLLGIINDILLVGAMRAGTMPIKHQLVHMGSVVDHVLNSLAPLAAKDVMIEKAVASKLSPFIGDRSRVIQILSNLVGNCLKFTTKGKVSIKVYHDSEGRNVIVKVADTGCGIPKDKLLTIWNAFEQADMTVTRKFGGTGLGLNIVKQLIESHDGEISMDSVLGQGTSVTFRLPVLASDAEEPLEQELKDAYEAVGYNFDKLTSYTDSRAQEMRTGASNGGLARRSIDRASLASQIADLVVEEINWDSEDVFYPGAALGRGPPSANVSRSNMMDGGLRGPPSANVSRASMMDGGLRGPPSANVSRTSMMDGGLRGPSKANSISNMLETPGAAFAPLPRKTSNLAEDVSLSAKLATASASATGRRKQGSLGSAGIPEEAPPQWGSERTSPPGQQQQVAMPSGNNNWQQILSEGSTESLGSFRPGQGLGRGGVERELSRNDCNSEVMDDTPTDDGPMAVRSGQVKHNAPAKNKSSKSMRRGRSDSQIRSQNHMESGKPPYSSVHGSIQIFSVDDEEVNQIVLEEILSSAGYLFVHAMDAMEAQEMLDEWDTIPDLMLVDSMMPGMSGQEFISGLRRLLPATVLPIIMVSAKTDELNIVSGLNSGSNDFVRKPYQRLELLARINAQLRVKNEVWWMSDMANEKSEGNMDDYGTGNESSGSYANTALRLLSNFLPENVIDRMQKGGGQDNIIADNHEHVVILFADIVGFYRISNQLSPEEVFLTLSNMFTAFDKLTDRFGVYKVETIADSYIVAAGHDESPDKAQLGAPVERVLQFAAAMLTVVRHITTPDGEPVYMRIGVHCGPSFAGIIGHKCPRYCFLGETVTTAATIESTSFPMAIHVSQAVVDSYATYAMDGLNRIAELFAPLGEREVQNKVINTFLLKDGNWEEALRTMRKAQHIQRSMSLMGTDPRTAADAADAVIRTSEAAMGITGIDNCGTTRRSMEHGRLSTDGHLSVGGDAHREGMPPQTQGHGLGQGGPEPHHTLESRRSVDPPGPRPMLGGGGGPVPAARAPETQVCTPLDSNMLVTMKSDLMDLRSDQEACMIHLSQIAANIQEIMSVTKIPNSNGAPVYGWSSGDRDTLTALSSTLPVLSGMDTRLAEILSKVEWSHGAHSDVLKVLQEIRLSPGEKSSDANDWPGQNLPSVDAAALKRVLRELERLHHVQQHSHTTLVQFKGDTASQYAELLAINNHIASEMKLVAASAPIAVPSTSLSSPLENSPQGWSNYGVGQQRMDVGKEGRAPGYNRLFNRDEIPAYGLADLLEDLDLESHLPHFMSQGIQLWVLLDMSPNSLTNLGISQAGSRKALSDAVHSLACNLLRWCQERSFIRRTSGGSGQVVTDCTGGGGGRIQDVSISSRSIPHQHGGEVHRQYRGNPVLAAPPGGRGPVSASSKPPTYPGGSEASSSRDPDSIRELHFHQNGNDVKKSACRGVQGGRAADSSDRGAGSRGVGDEGRYDREGAHRHVEGHYDHSHSAVHSPSAAYPFQPPLWSSGPLGADDSVAVQYAGSTEVGSYLVQQPQKKPYSPALMQPGVPRHGMYPSPPPPLKHSHEKLRRSREQLQQWAEEEPQPPPQPPCHNYDNHDLGQEWSDGAQFTPLPPLAPLPDLGGADMDYRPILWRTTQPTQTTGRSSKSTTVGEAELPAWQATRTLSIRTTKMMRRRGICLSTGTLGLAME